MKINIKKIFKLELKEFIKSKKFLIIIISCLLVFFIALFIFSYQLETPLSKDTEEKIFVVEKGQGAEKIAENLRTQGFTSNKWTFFYYIWLKGKTKELQAGEYSLTPSMSILEIAKKILEGDIIKDWVKITIPEGWSIKEIEKRLIASGLIKSGEKLPQQEEGYLFPDTYHFYKEVTIEQIVGKMRDNFNRKVDEKLKKEIEKQGKELYDILIMASILEKEVITDEDRAIVSGIFWDRLKINYPLESCATIAYILEVDKWRYSIEDTRIKSPYNTYTNIGLPPTPINNPGLSAIKAAIYPKISDYFFFLTDPETGQTIFSKTFEEHSQNKAKYFGD